MNKDTLQTAIELCLAVYRITDKFPREEILGQKLRGLAIDTIEYLVYSKALPTDSGRIFNLSPRGGSPAGGEELERKIHVLSAYFAVAEKQGWVDERNFAVLREKYRDLYMSAQINTNAKTEAHRYEAIAEADKKQANSPRLSERQARLTARQAKILEFLRGDKKGRIISDIAEKIKASNKTAERELKKVIGAGMAKKHGNTKGARFLSL